MRVEDKLKIHFCGDIYTYFECATNTYINRSPGLGKRIRRGACERQVADIRIYKFICVKAVLVDEFQQLKICTQ